MPQPWLLGVNVKKRRTVCGEKLVIVGWLRNMPKICWTGGEWYMLKMKVYKGLWRVLLSTLLCQLQQFLLPYLPHLSIQYMLFTQLQITLMTMLVPLPRLLEWKLRMKQLVGLLVEFFVAIQELQVE